MTEDEALLGVRLLAAIARADGTVDTREREALVRALDEFKPASSPSLESLLSDPVDFDTACAGIVSRDGQRAVFAAAMAVAMIDGVDPAERRLLDRMRAAFEITTAPENIYETVRGGRAFFDPSNIAPIADPVMRRHETRAVMMRWAIWAGAAAFGPVPVLDGLVVGTMQVVMCTNIARLWGSPLTTKQVITGSLGAFAGNGAMLAAASLLKLVPGWGHAVTAGLAFVNTITVAMLFEERLRRGTDLTREEIREVITRARAEAKDLYASERVRVERAREAEGPTIDSLSRAFQDGTLSIEEFERRVAALEGLSAKH